MSTVGLPRQRRDALSMRGKKWIRDRPERIGTGAGAPTRSGLKSPALRTVLVCRCRPENGHDGRVTAQFEATCSTPAECSCSRIPPCSGHCSRTAAIRPCRRTCAHYAGMTAKSAAGSGEAFWDEYNPRSQHRRARARVAIASGTLQRHVWRWPIPTASRHSPC
jgi:hypothetical protein